MLRSLSLIYWLGMFTMVASSAELARSTASGLVVVNDGSTICVSGLSGDRMLVVDVARRAILNTSALGGQLGDVVRLDDNRLLVLDTENRELIVVRLEGGSPRTEQRLALGIDPRRIAVARDGSSALVTSRWSQAVQRIVLQSGEAEAEEPVELGFEAEEVVALPDGKFVVADALGGHLAVFDTEIGQARRVRSLSGHNLRGMALNADGRELWISHQVLSRVAHSDRDDIHWGNLVQNVVTRLPVDTLANPSENISERAAQIALGDVGNGFADPTGIVAIPDGLLALSGGAGQLLLWRNGAMVRRWNVGRRPTRLALLPDRQVVVLNEHDRSLSFIDWTQYERVQRIEIPDGLTSNLTPGEVAFYDANLAHDSWMTCNSCHVDGHTPSRLADTLGDGDFGNPKRIPSLFGVGDTGPFGWRGNHPDLLHQVEASLQSTMHSEELAEPSLPQLVDFIRSLPPLPARPPQDDVSEWEAGKRLFTDWKCVQCHPAPAYTIDEVRDVGLRDELGHRQFNPPSLRGLRYRRSFFHDGRAKSLETVFEIYAHQLPAEVTPAQRQQLLAFLRTL